MNNITKKQKTIKDEDLKQNISMRFVPVERENNADEKPQGYVEGWASTDSLDAYDSIFEAGAFDKSIRERGIRGPRGIKFLVGHDWDKPAGRIEELEYKGNRLWIAAQFGLQISYVKDFYEAMKMQEGFNFSIGATIKKYYFDEEDVLHIVEADLYEVSAVPFPGNEDCVMTSIRAHTENQFSTMAEFEKFLVSRGLVKSRRNANEIARVAKSCSHLFRDNDTAHAGSDNDNKSLLTNQKITEVTQQMRKLREALNK